MILLPQLVRRALLLGVSVLPKLLLCEPSGLGQQQIAFQAALPCARLDAAWPQPDPRLGDEYQ